MTWPYIMLAGVAGEVLLALAVGKLIRGPRRCTPGPSAASGQMAAPSRADADGRLRKRIRRVIDADSVVIVFQPILACDTHAPLGFQALSRFAHLQPAAPPDVWFARAARVGLGAQLELLAARRALDAAADLPDRAFLSLNLSPATILTGRVGALLTQSGWPADRTVLEITEHDSVADYAALRTALEPLRHSGVRVAVDDAGAGYASFRRILSLAPDYLKLDRSLVEDVDTDPGRRALVAAVTRFAHDIGATVIAEGVQTASQFAMVAALNVDAVQGFAIARPDLLRRRVQRAAHAG